MTDTCDTPMDRFIEQMGLFAQAEGAPRTLTQMAEALKISKASASNNARLLELKGADRRTSPVGQPGDAYEALDMPNTASIRALAERHRGWAATIGEITREFPQTQEAAQERIGRYAGFDRDTAGFIDAWMDQVDDKNGADAPAERPAAGDEE